MGQVSTPRPPTSTSVYPQLPQTSTQPILSQPPVGPIYSTPIPTNDNPYRPPQQTEPVPVAQPPQPISSGTPLPYPTSGPQRYHSSIDNPASSESQLPNPYSTIGQPAVPDVPSQTAQRPEQGRYGTPLPYPTSGPRLSSPAQYPAGSDSHLPNPYSGAGQPPVIVPPGDDGQSTYSGHHPDQDWDNRRDDDGRHTPLSTIEEYTEPPSRPTSVRPPPRLDTQDSYNPPSATSPRPSYQDPWMPPSNPYGDATSSPYIYPPVYPYEPYGQTPYNLPEEDETACDKCGACLGKSLGILVWVLFWPILLPYMFCRRRKHEADNAGVHYPVATDEEAPGGSLYSKPESKLEVAVRYSTREIPKEVYNLFLLRLPSLYFSRVARIFEEADLSLSELKKMALETATKSNSYGPSAYFLEAHSNLPPVYESLKNTWEGFIDSVMREWKTFNIISVLLLSAILTILQIDAASNDGLTRYTAMASLVCALMSLLYGCVYIIRFGTMRKPYKAAEWALEAKKSRTLIFWNVWVLLAMPAVWLSWSLILYVCCIMSFLWRTSALDVDDTRPMSKSGLLAARVVITILLSLGIVYGALVVLTFRRYGEIMDRKWKQRIDGWIDAKINQELPPLPVDSYPPPALPYNQNPQTAHSLPYGYQPSTQQSAQPPSVYSTPASHSSYYPTPYSHSQPKTGYSGYSTYGPPPASWDKADKAPSYHEHEAFSDYYYSADRKASSADDSTPVPSPKVPAASAPQVDAPGSPDSLKSMYLPDSVAGAAQPLSASGTQDSSQPAPSQIATPSQQAVGTTPSGKSSTIDIEVAEPSSTSQSETSSSKRPYISIPPPPPPPPLPPKPSAWSRNTDTLILPSPAHAYDRNSPSSSIGVSPAGSMIRSYSGGGQSETSLLIRKEHSDGSDASGPASVHKERDGGHEQDSWKRASVDSFNDRLDEVLKSRK
ncbi:hypothetical protein CC2G_011359 [Coprinopsis cinerea AmutBmut pab1-1]|nr:hypothetical protein CC2G_011359 [Coprinopsis cinerea AmutBmut pab1-1]